MKLVHISIGDYKFDRSTNPFAFDALSRHPIDNIATKISNAIDVSFNASNIIVRGIQSGAHNKKMSRDELIDIIQKNGNDNYENSDEQVIIFAAKYSSQKTIESILSGFHVYKPKCYEIPHYPVDIWMIFDADMFENISYLHPVHHVIAKDKWKLKYSNSNALVGILIIN